MVKQQYNWKNRGIILKKKLLASCLIFYISPSFSIDNIDWKRETLTALTKIKSTLKRNSSQSALHDTSFLQWLNEGYNLSVKKTSTALSEEKFFYTLAYYVSGFKDPHIYLSANNNKTKLPLHFSGITVYYQYGHYYVNYRDNNNQSIPIHAELLSCDNMSIDALIKKDIMPYNDGSPIYPAIYYRRAQQLMIDQNPYRQYPLH
jgi:hypothetical protein